MAIRALFFSVILSSLVLGCSSDDNSSVTESSMQNPSISEDGSTVGISGSYTVDAGYSVPLNGDLAVLWTVSSASPDYLYISPGQFIDDTRYSLSLPERLEPEAINSYGVAVGLVAIFSQASGPAAGVVEDIGEDGLLGFSENHAIIYRAPDANQQIIEWAGDFPVGYSCGRIERVADGLGFDSFVPASCSEMSVRIGDLDTFEGMNWT